MKKLFGKNVVPSCSYCQNGKKDKTKQVFCTKKLIYIKDNNQGQKCKKYRYNPYDRIPKVCSLV
ncbi:MAG: hypothetical protein LBF33_00530 [Oscillospiraceae bacterium]|nr:hypothetical protein [Oscillospiraceae bacterium]